MHARRARLAAAAAVIGLQATAGVAAAAEAEPAPAFTEAGQLLAAVALILLFGGFLFTGIVLYLVHEQRRYFDAVEHLAERGIGSEPVHVSSTVPGAPPAADPVTGEQPPADASEEFSIDGPAEVAVGTAADYRATVGAGAAEAAWSVRPAELAAVAPATGSTVAVVAVKPGPFRLTAAHPDGRTVTLGLTAAATRDRDATKLSRVAFGWGSIVIALAIAILVGVLGMAQVLDGQAIAGIYGTLAGYLFGVVASRGGSGEEQASTPAGGGTTGGTGTRAGGGQG
jgi:hypothetical protein